jgi:hypothetical protein
LEAGAKVNLFSENYKSIVKSISAFVKYFPALQLLSQKQSKNIVKLLGTIKPLDLMKIQAIELFSL